MLWFNQPPKPRVIHIPRHKAEAILTLLDEWEETESHVTSYNMWLLIEEAVPETKEGHWRLCANSAFPYVKEVL